MPKFFKATHLADAPLVVEIELARVEHLHTAGGETRATLICYFRGRQEGLPVNKTNHHSIAAIAGTADSTKWRGVVIEIFKDVTELYGEHVACVRVRAPPVGARGVDFNGRALKPAARKRPCS